MLRIGAASNGASSCCITSQAVSTVSSEKNGCSPATHSPQPAQPFATQLHQQDASVGGGSKTGFKWFNEGKA